jgi:hypothetical protein
MVSHNQDNSTNPWIGLAFSLTYPNPEYGPPHFNDETYGDVKMPGYNVRGRNGRGISVPVPI